MRSFTLSGLFAAAALATGCAANGTYGYTTVSAGYYTPDLVYVGPGVSVIADYPEPIFYSNNYYWRYYNNSWYRSPYYNRGWSYYARPPIAVSRIQSPYRYRHYRPPGYTVRRDYRYDQRSYPYDRGRYDRGRYDRDRYNRDQYNRQQHDRPQANRQPYSRDYQRERYQRAQPRQVPVRQAPVQQQAPAQRTDRYQGTRGRTVTRDRR